jgi:hypothetical protein
VLTLPGDYADGLFIVAGNYTNQFSFHQNVDIDFDGIEGCPYCMTYWIMNVSQSFFLMLVK